MVLHRLEPINVRGETETTVKLRGGQENVIKASTRPKYYFNLKASLTDNPLRLGYKTLTWRC